MIFEIFTKTSPQKITMKLLYTASNTGRNGEEREEIRGEIR